MIQQIQDNLTISQIVKFWRQHSIEEKSLANSIKESYVRIIQESQLKDTKFSIRDNQWYKDSDVSKFYVAINTKENSLQIVNNARNFDDNPNLIGFVEITTNQFEFLQVLTVDKQISLFIKFVKEIQLLYSASLNKVFLKINQIEGLSKDQANDVFIAHNLHFVSDNELTEMWHTDFETVMKIASGD